MAKHHDNTLKDIFEDIISVKEVSEIFSMLR